MVELVVRRSKRKVGLVKRWRERGVVVVLCVVEREWIHLRCVDTTPHILPLGGAGGGWIHSFLVVLCTPKCLYFLEVFGVSTHNMLVSACCEVTQKGPECGGFGWLCTE